MKNKVIAILTITLMTNSGYCKTPEELVEQLGSDHFRIREQAYRELTTLDKEALEAVKKNINHPDPEIRYRCRYWLNEYSECEPPNNRRYPPIWYMPNRYRWPGNERDHAYELYKEAYYAIKAIEYGKSDWGVEPPGYREKDIEELACEMFVKELRENGATRQEILDLYAEFWYNEDHYKFAPEPYRGATVPSTMLLKEVSDNVFFGVELE